MEVSAFTTEGVDEMFELIIKEILPTITKAKEEKDLNRKTLYTGSIKKKISNHSSCK